MVGLPDSQPDTNAWIFVSHSSGDLAAVRQVRNYLEEKGAAPVLFHLKALTDPEEFWPLIEREIMARNFFLYCESAAAERSRWVRREREAVQRAATTAPKRIGSIRVDQDEVDRNALDRFLSVTRIFPSFSRRDLATVEPFLSALRTAGFQVFDELPVPPSTNYPEAIFDGLKEAARDGWVVIFVSAASVKSDWVRMELRAATRLGARLIPVLIEPAELPIELMGIQYLHATQDPRGAAVRLVHELLRRAD